MDNTKTIDEIGEVKVDQVFLGTSCNGRLEDLQIAARILKGKSIHPKTRMIVTPGSRRVYKEALKDGTMETFIESGAMVTPPGCGGCVGLHEGVLGDGEVCLATQPRNFKGRMGSPKSFIYLGSPAVAAATAIEGKIADPRKYLSRLLKNAHLGVVLTIRADAVAHPETCGSKTLRQARISRLISDLRDF